MKTSYKILLATDYSDAVKNAERYAFQFAKSTGSLLQIIHVFAPPLSIPAPPFDPEKIDNNPGEYEMEKLKDHTENIVQALKIKPEELRYACVVREGNIISQVVEEAKETDTDFIIVGTHGTRGFRELLLGTNTWSIIKSAECPVFAIPEDAMYTPVKNIVFATDYREGEIPVINYLIEVARSFDAELTLLHISNYSVSKEFEVKLYEDFRNKVSAKINWQKLKIRLIHSEKIIEGLNNFCIRTKTNWLVMSPEKHDLLEKIFDPTGSKTRKMSFHSSIPLLAIPELYATKNYNPFREKHGREKENA